MASVNAALQLLKRLDVDYGTDDHPLEPVEERQALWRTAVVWMGFAFFPAGILAVVSIASQLTPLDLLVSLVVGCVILAAISAVQGLIGQQTGLSFGLLTRFVFGNKYGKWIPSLVGVVALTGWDSFNLAVVAQITGKFVGMEWLYPYLVVGFLLLFLLTAIGGFGFLSRLSQIAVPLVGLLVLLAALLSVNQTGGVGGFFETAPDTSKMGLVAAVTAITGTFAFGTSIVSPDIQRWCKSRRDALLTGVVSFGGAYLYLLFLGGVAGIASGAEGGHLSEILAALGLLPLGFVALAAQTWTTCDNEYYSTSLTLSQLSGRYWKPYFAVLVGLTAAALAILRIQQFLFEWLTLASATATPLMGVFAADYFFLEKGNYPTYDDLDELDEKLPSLKVASYVGWILGSAAIIYTLRVQPFFIPQINGIVVAFVVTYVAGRLYPQPAETGTAAAATGTDD